MTGGGRPDNARRILLAAAGAILVAVGMLVAWLLVDTRREVTRAVAVAASNVATTVAQDVDRNIELLDLSLQAVTEAWVKPEVRGLEPTIRQMVLFDRAASARGFGSWSRRCFSATRKAEKTTTTWGASRSWP